ncbi:hypothetical protein NPIL_12811 [Nephila pilipes]|uniref:Uncharacterized protein n=1 Tax=Nephila pilipes TaxID=299642 RepID=A0A8X6PTD9_NEPPI|nr:hypothetical protein NPIL_12811 [Nephila pilipes]
MINALVNIPHPKNNARKDSCKTFHINTSSSLRSIPAQKETNLHKTTKCQFTPSETGIPNDTRSRGSLDLTPSSKRQRLRQLLLPSLFVRKLP